MTERASGAAERPDRGRGRRALGWAAAGALLAALCAAAFLGWDPVGFRATAAEGSAFVFEPEARAALAAVWRESVETKEERVACLGGRLNGGIFRIERAQPVPLETADSASILPGPSLDRCGPPRWAGTVHTHIVAAEGGRPYATLSPPDREVMRLWKARWRVEGLFCVLYSESEAYCEYGRTLSGEARYAPGGAGG